MTVVLVQVSCGADLEVGSCDKDTCLVEYFDLRLYVDLGHLVKHPQQ